MQKKEGYDQETLARVQKEELNILRDFDNLCKKHNLSYFGFAGTGIGAVRHQGFIPWDDDIDVAMPRADYDQFIRFAEAEYGDTYKILNAETRKNYPLMTMQWTKIGTKFVTVPFKSLDCDFGIYLDIFPFDNVPDDPKKRASQAKRTWFWSKLLILRNLPSPTYGGSDWKTKVLKAIFWCIHIGLSICCIPRSWIHKKCYEASIAYNHEDTKRFAFLSDTLPYLYEYDKTEVYPLIKMPFEDLEISFPNQLDKLLRDYYGDYMQLPAEENRINHCPHILDFGDKTS